VEKHGKDAFYQIRGASYNTPEHFTDDIISTLLKYFTVAPYDMFSILHILAAKFPERKDKLLGIYLELFDKAPKDAIGELYYLIANDKELANRELIEAMLRNGSADLFQVIYTHRMILARRPDLIEKKNIEWVRDNCVHGANQAFYFLRDIAKEYPEHASLCVQALFQCVLTFHSNAYKKDFLSDLISIAHASHVKAQFAEALRKPVEGGNPAARELMAIIFRDPNQRKQLLMLEQMERALDWDRVWDFFVFLLENPVSKKDLSTDVAEIYLDGIYRLSFLLNGHEFKQMVYDVVDLSKALPKDFDGTLLFLNDAEVPTLRGKVELFASRLGEQLELKAVSEFLDRGNAMSSEAHNLEERISKEPNESKKAQMSKRLENLRSRLADIEKVPERALHNFRSEVQKELRAHLARLVRLFMVRSRKAAVKTVSIRVLGYESDLWEADEKVYPALFLVERLTRSRTRQYLVRLIEDRINKRESNWLWTEPPVIQWVEDVKKGQPKADLSRWRHEFKRSYCYKKRMTADEKNKRIEEELSEVRVRMRTLKIEVLDSDDETVLLQKLEAAKLKDPAPVAELRSDLERIRRYTVAPVTDFEGDLNFYIETDPFQYLFMGEYGFASCLSMHGVNFWSAVSNAIDVDKCVVWVTDSHGNIFARRLIALTPQGLVSYRTYTNRQALALNKFFDRFIKEYAEHCGVCTTKDARPGPLLSDSWYDDGSVDVQ
jgi:hypothetical protein